MTNKEKEIIKGWLKTTLECIIMNQRCLGSGETITILKSDFESIFNDLPKSIDNL